MGQWRVTIIILVAGIIVSSAFVIGVVNGKYKQHLLMDQSKTQTRSLAPKKSVERPAGGVETLRSRLAAIVKARTSTLRQEPTRGAGYLQQTTWFGNYGWAIGFGNRSGQTYR